MIDLKFPTPKRYVSIYSTGEGFCKGSRYINKHEYYSIKRSITKFIKKYEVGNVFYLFDVEIAAYLGYTIDGKLIFMNMTHGRWNVNEINMYDTWEYPYPRLNKNLLCTRSKEEIELIVSKYITKDRSKQRKNFIATLSNNDNGLNI